MRPAQILALAGVATAQVVTSASNGTVATMTTPQSTVNTQAPNWGNTTASASATWSPVTTIITSTQLVGTPGETASVPEVPTAGATPQRMEGSVVGLLGFVIAGLLVL